VKEKPINPRLTEKQCWEMVNRIQRASTFAGWLERCRIAEKWLRANENLSNEAYDSLMRTVSAFSREAYSEIQRPGSVFAR